MAKRKKPQSLIWKPNPEGTGHYMRYKLGFIFRDKGKYTIKVGWIKQRFKTNTLREAKMIIDVYVENIYKNIQKGNNL